MDVGRIIRTEACVQEGADWLAQREARFAEALEAPVLCRCADDGTVLRPC